LHNLLIKIKKIKIGCKGATRACMRGKRMKKKNRAGSSQKLLLFLFLLLLLYLVFAVLQRQKRPAVEAKETCYRGKRDLL
jgi:hypothetical protein